MYLGEERDGIGHYLSQIGRYSFPTRQEELELLRRAHQGDQRAKSEMVIRNMKLCVAVAKKFLGHGLPLDALINEAVFGLNRAIEKFDPGKGCKFSTYAYPWVMQSLQRACEAQAHTIKKPYNVWESDRRINRAIRRIHQANTVAGIRRAPTLEEIKADTGFDEEKIRTVRAWARVHAVGYDVFNRQGDTVGDTFTALDITPDDSPAPWEVVERSDRVEAMRRFLQDPDITREERYVLARRYGLTGEEPTSFTEIGRTMGIHRNIVVRHHRQALRKLRKMAREQGLGD